ncbi:NAD(P)/FAD-dependent oxidoreductase [Mycolicibacterium grossiae]|uniref:FAD-dependent oxidoreductase n=1 Tax=Mycolicibacterium grossiae TaxID=1552759 RepID=A0A1E8Q4T2_9MYCO|nr:FAD-dependent oxidoreductase [Mycolicibacterium grossiae]OFJ53638.1 FAD-dependent oxidoreductase [Mycolicibacterium grossiae]QEM46764.1 NAD(P)/FAD-dependent oxidoreductase [Mycolicibacterium grossiae]
MPTPTFVIVGAGLAGATAAEALRDDDVDGRIVLFGAEEQLPYERPPLSKDFLTGEKRISDFHVKPAEWYRDNDVDLRLGVTVDTLDCAARTVSAAGEQQPWDALLLATGSCAKRPSLPGADADGVHYLRTVDDAACLLGALGQGARLAVVGAGWIGLEVTACARQRGVDVTVVESAELPLLAALGREAAEVFARLHRDHGVDLRLGARVAAITVRDGRAAGLTLADGAAIEADAVLVAIGAEPNVGLATRAGLAVGNGVLVDAALRTSAPDVFAVGDIAAHDHPLYGTRIRTEHWANARTQPAAAVAGMLGRPTDYAELPYFYTDQYDLGMEYVGYAPAYDRVVFRGDVDGREFTAFYLDAERRVLAGMNVNVWDGLDDVRDVIRARRPVDPARLADTGVDLADL